MYLRIDYRLMRQLQPCVHVMLNPLNDREVIKPAINQIYIYTEYRLTLITKTCVFIQESLRHQACVSADIQILDRQKTYVMSYVTTTYLHVGDRQAAIHSLWNQFRLIREFLYRKVYHTFWFSEQKCIDQLNLKMSHLGLTI